MSDAKLRVLVFGAHPDDCDFTAGGVAALYARQGHTVRFVSVTNGDAGHHETGGARLAQRRRAEAEAAGAVIGVEYQVLDNHDGQLMPTLENRWQIIALIREFRPDLIMSPRPNDYHPDHRYTAQLIQDAAYMVTVPNVVAFHEHLPRDPVIVYVSDTFQKPYPFTPDVVVAIDEVVDRKLDMFHAHTSQFYEWLPYNGGYLSEVPADEGARRAWLRRRYEPRLRRDAERFRDKLIELYGAEIGRRVQYAEAFEGCEYGGRLTPENMRRLFPFFPT
ncbi:MAG TPA: PIG-L family deacetylase [Roseiflexaceae bacterium]|nr:PIG-L family deacetylase [Roseiflexaceae bacterium]